MGRIKMPSGHLFRRGQSDLHKLKMSKPKRKNTNLQLGDVANIIRLGESLYESPLLRDTLGAFGEMGAGLADWLDPDDDAKEELIDKAAKAKAAEKRGVKVEYGDPGDANVAIENPGSAAGVPHMTTKKGLLDAGLNLDKMPPHVQRSLTAGQPKQLDPIKHLDKEARNKQLVNWKIFRTREAELNMLDAEAAMEAPAKASPTQPLPSTVAPAQAAFPNDIDQLLPMLKSAGATPKEISTVKWHKNDPKQIPKGIEMAHELLRRYGVTGAPPMTMPEKRRAEANRQAALMEKTGRPPMHGFGERYRVPPWSGVAPAAAPVEVPMGIPIAGQEPIGIERLRMPTLPSYPQMPTQLQMPSRFTEPTWGLEAGVIPSGYPDIYKDTEIPFERFKTPATPAAPAAPAVAAPPVGKPVEQVRQKVIAIINSFDRSPAGERAAVQKALNVGFNIADNLKPLSEAVVATLEQSGQPYSPADLAAITNVVAQQYHQRPQAAAAPAGIDLTVEWGDNLGEVQAKAYALGRQNADPRHLEKLLSQLGNIAGVGTGGGGWARWLSAGRKGGYFQSPDAASKAILAAYEQGRTGTVKAQREAEMSELRQHRLMDYRDPLRQRKRQAQAEMAEHKLQKARDYVQHDKADRALRTATASVRLAALLEEHYKPAPKSGARPPRGPKPKDVATYNKALIKNSGELQKFNSDYQKSAQKDTQKLGAVLNALQSGNVSKVPSLTDDEIIQLYGTNANAYHAGLRAAQDDERKRDEIIARTQSRIHAIRRTATLVNALQDRVVDLHDAIIRQLTTRKTAERDEKLTELHNQLTDARQELNRILGVSP